jgi:hypothetical protein
MLMLDALITALGLGIAGIDPLGAVLLMTAIASQFTRSKIIFFNVLVLVSAVLVGTILSVVGASFLSNINDIFPENTSSVWVYVNLLIAAVTTVWLIRRYLNRNKPKNNKSTKKLGSSYYAIAVTAVLFGAGSVFDPTFLAAISLAAQTNNLATIVAMHTIWIITSQIMLFVLFIAYLNGKHEKVITYSREQYTKHKSLLQNVLYVAAIGVIIVLIADSISYLVSGNYLINL